MFGKVSNLLVDYCLLEYSGVDLLCLSFWVQGMVEVIVVFDWVCKGVVLLFVVEGCNGYWYGWLGMLWVEEVGLC